TSLPRLPRHVVAHREKGRFEVVRVEGRVHGAQPFNRWPTAGIHVRRHGDAYKLYIQLDEPVKPYLRIVEGCSADKSAGQLAALQSTRWVRGRSRSVSS